MFAFNKIAVAAVATVAMCSAPTGVEAYYQAEPQQQAAPVPAPTPAPVQYDKNGKPVPQKGCVFKPCSVLIEFFIGFVNSYVLSCLAPCVLACCSDDCWFETIDPKGDSFNDKMEARWNSPNYQAQSAICASVAGLITAGIELINDSFFAGSTVIKGTSSCCFSCCFSVFGASFWTYLCGTSPCLTSDNAQAGCCACGDSEEKN